MKRFFTLVFALTLFCAGLSAQTAAYRTDRNIAYRDAAGDGYADSLCRLDICYPTDAKGFPTVVWFHGGGLTGGRREIPKALCDKGFAVVGVDYRLAPRVKVADCVEDAAAAAAWVVRNIASYGGDPGLIFIAGHSAGGYLTSMIGMDKRWMAPYGIDPDTAFARLSARPDPLGRPRAGDAGALRGERLFLAHDARGGASRRADLRIRRLRPREHASGGTLRRGALHPRQGEKTGKVIACRKDKRNRMNGWMKLAAAFFAAASLTGCSLLKVAVATGDPLSKEEMNVRTMTRGFYYDMAGEVARAADSIASLSPDVNTRVAAVRWKIRATRAGVNAAMQGIPDVALADMWILCRRMNDAFSAAPDSLLFGPRSGIARDAVRRLDLRAGRLARQVLPADRYDLMASFVEEYVRKNPASEGDETDNTTLAWLEYLRDNGVEHAYATGSIAEVLADVNDRLSGQTRQMSNSIGWSKDIFEMRLEQDSLRLQVGAQLDSLERSFNRIVVVAEHVPEISDRVLEELNRQVTQLIGTMNASIDNAFAGFDRQRDELQRYVTREREALVEQLRQTGDDLVRTTLDAVPGLVGKVLLYLVLALAVLIGGPFALGFWLGGVRQRAKSRIKDEELKMKN